MLTPKPAYPGRILLARRGVGQVTLPSRTSPSAMAGGAAFTRRGLWGLGQTVPDVSTDTSAVYTTDTTGSDLPLGVPYYTGAPISASSGGGTTTPPFTPATTGGVPTWLQSIIGSSAKTAQTIALQQTNPFNPSNLPAGYYQASGPGGTVISTAGSPFTSGALTTASLTSGLNSMLPILLIGGVVLLMMSRK